MCLTTLPDHYLCSDVLWRVSPIKYLSYVWSFSNISSSYELCSNKPEWTWAILSVSVYSTYHLLYCFWWQIPDTPHNDYIMLIFNIVTGAEFKHPSTHLKSKYKIPIGMQVPGPLTISCLSSHSLITARTSSSQICDKIKKTLQGFSKCLSHLASWKPKSCVHLDSSQINFMGDKSMNAQDVWEPLAYTKCCLLYLPQSYSVTAKAFLLNSFGRYKSVFNWSS